MPALPDFDEFARLARGHALVPVYRRLTSDLLTPVSAFASLDDGGTACLFESVVGGERVGRYSFLATDPDLVFAARGDELTVTSERERARCVPGDPMSALRDLVAARCALLPDLPPFIGGAVGYAAYDVVRYAEHLPSPPTDDRGLPDMSFALYRRIVVFDHVEKVLFVIGLAEVEPGSGEAAVRKAYDDACRAVDRLVERLESPKAAFEPIELTESPAVPLEWDSSFAREDFLRAVRRSIEYIEAGDIFQVVLSQRLSVACRVDPFRVYRTLRVVNPSPFMFFLRTPETTLVGSSPEIMCRVWDGVITVRPLAGTRPRGATPAEDAALEAELLADEKERAEHVMLVDLGRNDVGRVAAYGSVELSDVMEVERYSHVMHITSNVAGRLRPECDAVDAFQAALPAGTVSGAPKVRAMEIIDELEPVRRGPYAGAVGYLDFRGNMDTCIALRTIVFRDGRADIQAGAGIVADSVPEREYDETLNKARGLLRAIELAEGTAAES